MFVFEKWSVQRIFRPNWGAEQAKTPHVALMNHPLITTIYLGTDNLTTSSQASKLRKFETTTHRLTGVKCRATSVAKNCRYSTSTGLHVDAQ